MSNGKASYLELLQLRAQVVTEKEHEMLYEFLEYFYDFGNKQPALTAILLEMGLKRGLPALTQLLQLWKTDPDLVYKIINDVDSAIRDPLLACARPDQIFFLRAFLLLTRERRRALFEKEIQGSVEAELVWLLFPQFSPPLLKWIQTLFSLYGLKRAHQWGKGLFAQLPAEVAKIFFHLYIVHKKWPESLKLFETWVHHFPSPSLASQFLLAVKHHEGDLGSVFNYMLENLDEAPPLIARLAQQKWSLSLNCSTDEALLVIVFLMKHADLLCEKLENIKSFYSNHWQLLHEVVNDKKLEENQKLVRIYKAMQSPLTQQWQHGKLIQQCKKLFPQCKAKHFEWCIKNGYAKEIAALVELHSTEGASPVVTMLLQAVATRDKKLLHAILEIYTSPEGQQLLELFGQFKVGKPWLRSLVLACAAGCPLLVQELLPMINEGLKISPFLKLLHHNEWLFAEKLLESKGAFSKEILNIQSVALQKELFFLAQTASQKVWQFCLAECVYTTEVDKSLERVSSLHYLIVKDGIGLEKWIDSLPPWEIWHRVDQAMAAIASEIDQKMAHQMEKHRGGDSEALWEEKIFSILAAHYLITPAGTLALALIAPIKKCHFFQTQKRQNTSCFRYLNNFFDLIQNRSDISLSLSEIKAPENSTSPSAQLVREICHLPAEQKVLDGHARIAALCALMTRPRQSEGIGSCFGTSILIQMHANPDTLLPLLKDYGSLITYGKIARTKKGKNQAIQDFPLRLFPSGAQAMLAAEHPLVKTLEFSIASMESKADQLMEKNVRLVDSWGLIGIKLWGITYRSQQKKPQSVDREKILSQIRSEFIHVVEAMYDPTFVYMGNNGGFVLVDRESKKVIYTDLQYRDLWMNVLRQAEKKLLSQFPQEIEVVKNIFLQLTHWMGSNNCESDSFLGILAYQSANQEGACLYKMSAGGYSPRSRCIYYGDVEEVYSTHIISLKNGHNGYDTFINALEMLPQNEKIQCLKYPDKLIPLLCFEHALSCMPGPILQQFAQGKTADAIREELQKDAEQKGCYVPTPEEKEEIVQQFIMKLPQKQSTLMYGLVEESHITTRSLTLHQFANALLTYANPMADQPALHQEWSNHLEELLFKIIPPVKCRVLFIGDFNWNYQHNNLLFAFGYSIITHHMQTYMATPNLEYMRPYSEAFHLEFYANTILHHKAK